MDQFITDGLINYIVLELDKHRILRGHNKIAFHNLEYTTDSMEYKIIIENINGAYNIIPLLIINDMTNVIKNIITREGYLYLNVTTNYNVSHDKLSVNFNIRLDITKINIKLVYELYSEMYRRYDEAERLYYEEVKVKKHLTTKELIDLELRLNEEQGTVSKCPVKVDNIIKELTNLEHDEFYWSYTVLYEEIFNKVRVLDSPFFDDNTICELFYSGYPNLSWIRSQLEYTINLKDDIKNVIIFYAYKGDTLITEFLKNKGTISDDVRKLFISSIEDIKQRGYINIIDMLKSYGADIKIFLEAIVRSLTEVIYLSPKVTYTFTVYRGLKTKIYPVVGDVYVTSSFMSTSLSIRKAIQFSTKHGTTYGTMMKMIVKSPCLFLENISPFGESEILFAPGVNLKLIDTVDNYEFIDMMHVRKYDENDEKIPYADDKYHIVHYEQSIFTTNYLTYEMI